ncbi:hypothetical protein [Sporisorium scitamineum]|uniref:Uncharacterized protein n=1 Tax=Sporisorium scitamineum TaxID=49012 RepID=A0A0F7S7Z2_9BASI|nr:hypothetical protein [Sporisorium scitamineum]
MDHTEQGTTAHKVVAWIKPQKLSLEHDDAFEPLNEEYEHSQ